MAATKHALENAHEEKSQAIEACTAAEARAAAGEKQLEGAKKMMAALRKECADAKAQKIDADAKLKDALDEQEARVAQSPGANISPAQLAAPPDTRGESEETSKGAGLSPVTLDTHGARVTQLEAKLATCREELRREAERHASAEARLVERTALLETAQKEAIESSKSAKASEVAAAAKASEAQQQLEAAKAVVSALRKECASAKAALGDADYEAAVQQVQNGSKGGSPSSEAAALEARCAELANRLAVAESSGRDVALDALAEANALGAAAQARCAQLEYATLLFPLKDKPSFSNYCHLR